MAAVRNATATLRESAKSLLRGSSPRKRFWSQTKRSMLTDIAAVDWPFWSVSEQQNVWKQMVVPVLLKEVRCNLCQEDNLCDTKSSGGEESENREQFFSNWKHWRTCQRSENIWTMPCQPCSLSSMASKRSGGDRLPSQSQNHWELRVC